jgi:hypothetical protein
MKLGMLISLIFDLKRILEKKKCVRDLFFAMWTRFIHETSGRQLLDLDVLNECPGLYDVWRRF